MTRTRLVPLLVVLVVAAVGAVLWVTRPDDAPATPLTPAQSRIEVDTPELRAVKQEVGVEPCPTGAQGRGEPGEQRSGLPDVALSCLGGGDDVTLSAVAGPAVVNLWASWCGPCEEELPLLARLDQEAGERLSVLGVDYQDPDPAGALTKLEEAGVTYPQLADPAGSLADELRIEGMPGTLYVDAAGEVTFVNAAFTSYAELTRLVRDHTGVDVTGR